MKIGIILVGFNLSEYVDICLDNWIRARQDKLGGHEFVICAVSVPFAGFPMTEEDDTVSKLRNHLERDNIDHLIDSPRNIPEATARSMCLVWLRGQGVDTTWMLDLDEFYTVDEISRILDFMTDNPWSTWFKISLRNMVLDDKTWLAEPFQPPRIHRIAAPGGYLASGFHSDNGVYYQRPWSGQGVADEKLAHLTIPPSVAWVKHDSWPNNERSRRKIEYQLKARGWPQCSFAWDEVNDTLIFNPALPTPKVIRA